MSKKISKMYKHLLQNVLAMKKRNVKRRKPPTISLENPDKKWKPPKKVETPRGVFNSANSVVHTVCTYILLSYGKYLQCKKENENFFNIIIFERRNF